MACNRAVITHSATAVGLVTIWHHHNYQQPHHTIFIVTPGFIQTFKGFFQDLQRPNSRVFQDSKNPFFPALPRKRSIIHSKHWLHEVKKCIYNIGYQCICIKVKKRKCNTWGCIIVLQWTRIRSTSSTTGSWLISNLNQILSEIKKSRSAALEL